MRFSRKFRVLIAGGGVAGVECALALRANAGERVALTLVAPDDQFVYRPLSVAEPFGLGEALSVPLETIARDVDAEYRHDTLASVSPAAHTVRLAGGDELPYDALVLAVGARRVPPFEHAIAFRGSEDSEAVHGLIQDLEAGYVTGVVFVVPSSRSWSLPLYELALMTARRAYDTCADSVRLTLITAEERPLEVFGNAASEDAAELLRRAGIALETATLVSDVSDRSVTLRPHGTTLECDRVVALASVVPHEVPGVPTDASGFVAVDMHGRVHGAVDVYAAGDATTFPLKQGGIACQQADALAEAIAQLAGAPIEPAPFRPMLRGQLLTGGRRRFMRTDVSGTSGDVSDVSPETLWWPPSKVAGAYLAPYLAALQHGAAVAAGSVRERIAVVPASGGPEFEILGFERDSPLSAEPR
jgi:sulfide:quinone oxidoreductase